MINVLEKLNQSCREEGVCEPLPVENDHEIFLHFAVVELCSPGIVVNENRAETGTCTCFKHDGKENCWSPGIIGMLNKDQQGRYCSTKTFKEEPKLVERYHQFAEAAGVAHKKLENIPKGERLEPWLHTMSEELSKRGISI